METVPVPDAHSGLPGTQEPKAKNPGQENCFRLRIGGQSAAMPLHALEVCHRFMPTWPAQKQADRVLSPPVAIRSCACRESWLRRTHPIPSDGYADAHQPWRRCAVPGDWRVAAKISALDADLLYDMLSLAGRPGGDRGGCAAALAADLRSYIVAFEISDDGPSGVPQSRLLDLCTGALKPWLPRYRCPVAGADRHLRRLYRRRAASHRLVAAPGQWGRRLRAGKRDVQALRRGKTPAHQMLCLRYSRRGVAAVGAGAGGQSSVQPADRTALETPGTRSGGCSAKDIPQLRAAGEQRQLDSEKPDAALSLAALYNPCACRPACMDSDTFGD